MTVAGPNNPIWAISQIDFAGADGLQITTATNGPLGRVSSVEVTSDTLSVSVPDLRLPPGHGRGPQIPPVIIRLYLWACDTGKVTFHSIGKNPLPVGFAFGHAEAVDDWRWIDAKGITVDWPS